MKYSFVIPVLVFVFLFAATPVEAASFQVSAVEREYVGRPPTCKSYFTYKKPRVGESTTLLWRSQKAEYMTGLYTNEKQPSRGRQNIVFGHPGEQVFKLTFTGPGGTTTCTQKIMVRGREAA